MDDGMSMFEVFYNRKLHKETWRVLGQSSDYAHMFKSAPSQDSTKIT